MKKRRREEVPFAVVSFPLPADHWLNAPGDNEPPMPYRIGAGPERDRRAAAIGRAAQYALRAATMNGRTDWDPDAVVQNLIVGLLGYWTTDGKPTGRLVPRRRGGSS